jgi:peptidyl-prolyl cis-trans isomerase C
MKQTFSSKFLNKKFFGLVISAICCITTISVYAQNIAVVNGRPISKARFEQLLKMLPIQAKSPEIEKKLKENLITNELLLSEAYKKYALLSNDKQKEIQLQIDEMKHAVIMQAFIENYFDNAITEDELRQQYNAMQKNSGDKEYRARHILVKTEAEANTIIEDLKKGSKFEEIAKIKSIDKGSAVNGGDLDWAKPSMFVPSFSQAMVALNKNAISPAVKSQFGYHIIRLDDVRSVKPVKFEDMKNSIKQSIKANPEWQKMKIDALERKLRATAVIK